MSVQTVVFQIPLTTVGENMLSPSQLYCVSHSSLVTSFSRLFFSGSEMGAKLFRFIYKQALELTPNVKVLEMVECLLMENEIVIFSFLVLDDIPGNS